MKPLTCQCFAEAGCGFVVVVVGQFLAFWGWVEGESFGLFFFLTLVPEEPELENHSGQVCPAGSLWQLPIQQKFIDSRGVQVAMLNFVKEPKTTSRSL